MMISAAMIVKNEEECLPKCLATIKGLDEISICDTGSSDKTVELARSLGATVHTDYEWNDNFAEARNHSILKCSGDWILIIDADETLDCPVEELAAALQAIPPALLVASMDVKAARGGDMNRCPRVFRNAHGIHYQGAAHNHLSRVADVHIPLSITYGYSPAHDLDPNRTMRILHNEILRTPKAPRERFYLGREYYYREMWRDAIVNYEICLEGSTWAGERAEAWLQIAKCHRNMGDVPKALEAAVKAFTANPMFKEAYHLMGEWGGGAAVKAWEGAKEAADNSNVIFIREC